MNFGPLSPVQASQAAHTRFAWQVGPTCQRRPTSVLSPSLPLSARWGRIVGAGSFAHAPTPSLCLVGPLCQRWPSVRVRALASSRTPPVSHLPFPNLQSAHPVVDTPTSHISRPLPPRVRPLLEPALTHPTPRAWLQLNPIWSQPSDGGLASLIRPLSHALQLSPASQSASPLGRWLPWPTYQPALASAGARSLGSNPGSWFVIARSRSAETRSRGKLVKRPPAF
jgi:hypothetical protein